MKVAPDATSIVPPAEPTSTGRLELNPVVTASFPPVNASVRPASPIALSDAAVVVLPGAISIGSSPVSVNPSKPFG